MPFELMQSKCFRLCRLKFHQQLVNLCEKLLKFHSREKHLPNILCDRSEIWNVKHSAIDSVTYWKYISKFPWECRSKGLSVIQAHQNYFT